MTAPGRGDPPPGPRTRLATGLRRAWHGLGWRLVLLFLLLALAIVAIAAGGMQRAVGGPWRALLQPLVADYVDRLAAEIGTPPDPARARVLTQRLPLTLRIQGPTLQWDSQAEGSPARPPGRIGADRPPPHRHGPPGAFVVDDEAGPGEAARGWWTARRITADGHVLEFGIAQVPWRERPRSIGGLTVVALLLLTALAYLIVRHWLRPLRDIAAGVERYGQGRFDAPIPQRRHDELGDLAGRINAMAGRLQGMLDAKRTLLLAISHELRSPLTRARLNAELVDDGPAREALLRDLGEMRDLIQDLLESERLAGGHAALQREPTDLAALLRAVCDELTHDQPEVQLQLALDDTLGAQAVDPTRWRLMARNLIGNALRHGRDAQGRLRLSLRLGQLEGKARLSLRDHGPGVPADQLERLAEAFYRPDDHRGRRSGGVGLGLYLCRLIAEAHGGRLRFERAEPGLRVVVEWPLDGTGAAAAAAAPASARTGAAGAA